MNKKTLLKSIIGTAGIYLIVTLLAIIWERITPFRHGLSGINNIPILVGIFSAGSIAAGLLFKGQIYAWVWTLGTTIFNAVILLIAGGIDAETIFLYALLYVAPLLIPFFFVKFCLTVRSWEKERSLEGGTTTEDQPRNAFKTALDNPTEKQNFD